MDDRQIKILKDLIDFLEYEKGNAIKDGPYANMMFEFITTLASAVEELDDRK